MISHPTIVENANNARGMETRSLPTVLPYAVEKAAMVSASASRPDCQISGPAQRIPRAVIVHTTSVSTNTSKQPYIPSLKG